MTRMHSRVFEWSCSVFECGYIVSKQSSVFFFLVFPGPPLGFRLPIFFEFRIYASSSMSSSSPPPPGEYDGEVGEYAGEVGEYCGDVGEYAGDVGEYAGEVGEYAGDVGE